MSDTSVGARSRRRSLLIRGGIAGLALLGIGAALTSANWTDQVFFSADAQAATFNLQGSASATGPWLEYETVDGALVIPIAVSEFGDLVPSEEARTVEVYVRNDSTVPADLTVGTTTSGALFTGSEATTTSSATVDDTTLDPDEVTAVTITLTPGQIPDALQGAAGTIVVTVTGETQ